MVTGGSVGKREPEGVRGSEVVGRGAQPVHRRAHCCCCPTAIQKRFATPDYGRQKQWGGVDQGRIQAVAEAGAGGSFPRVSPYEHPPQPVGRVGALPTCPPCTPIWSPPALRAGHPLEACLRHFSRGPSQALARMREEGAAPAPWGSSPPPVPWPSPQAFLGTAGGSLSCSRAWGALAMAGLRGLPIPPGSLAPS